MKGFEHKMSKFFRQYFNNAIEWNIRVVREVPVVEPIRIIRIA